MVLNSFLLTQTIVAFINVLGLALIFLFIQNQPRSKLTRYFTLMTVLMFVWVDFAYLARIPGQADRALLWIRIAWAITPLLFIFVYFFINQLTGLYKKFVMLQRILLVFGFIFLLIVLFTSTVIKDIKFDENGVLAIVYGKLALAFFGSVFVFSILSFWSIILKLRTTHNVKFKKRLKYILFGLTFFLAMNTVFNIIYPYFLKVVHLYFFGDYSTIVFLSLIAYTITRYKFLNIKIFIFEFFSFALWLITAIEFFLAPTWFERWYKLGIFILAIVFGVLLIRFARREVEQVDKLEDLTEELRIVNKKLKQLDTAKSEFISIASHQLRTPLTIIKGYISMILEGNFGHCNQSQTESLEKVYASNERLVQLVENLLNISRIESGRLQFNFELLQFEDLINSVVDELGTNARKKGLKFDYIKPKEKLPKVMIDEEKIRQVVLNLIDNSIKYTRQGSVTVILKQMEKDIFFCVSDSGMGISKDSMPNLFKKFSRGSGTSLVHTEGTGLGLFVAKKMIDAHKGKIWAESEGKDRGSKFCFTLPMGQDVNLESPLGIGKKS
ncbi:ATP-binding protein [Patescibacteria group bacterium]